VSVRNNRLFHITLDAKTSRGRRINKPAHGRRLLPGSYAIVTVEFPVHYLMNFVYIAWEIYMFVY
jgi:hypothetical protein